MMTEFSCQNSLESKVTLVKRFSKVTLVKLECDVKVLFCASTKSLDMLK